MTNKLEEALSKAKDDRPNNWRYGQAVFNYTYEVYPELVDNYLRGSKNDCFYLDKKVDIYVDTLQNLIQEQKT